MYERFTAEAREVMKLANQEAQRFNHEYVGTEHVLLGILWLDYGAAVRALHAHAMDVERVRLKVEQLVERGPDMITMGRSPLTPRAQRVIEIATGQARERQHEFIGTGHLLFGLLTDLDSVSSIALRESGVNLADLQQALMARLDRPEEAETPPGKDVQEQMILVDPETIAAELERAPAGVEARAVLPATVGQLCTHEVLGQRVRVHLFRLSGSTDEAKATLLQMLEQFTRHARISAVLVVTEMSPEPPPAA